MEDYVKNQRNLERFVIEGTVLKSYKGNEQSVTLPDFITEIGEDAFKMSSNLTTVTIPGNVITIGEGAFYGCAKLKSVIISSGVERIEDYAFLACRALMTINIPDSVTYVGNAAFQNCTSLKTVVLPKYINGIELYTFTDCTSLTNVVVPNNISYIGNSAFQGCSSLESITVPCGTKIGACAIPSTTKISYLGQECDISQPNESDNDLEYWETLEMEHYAKAAESSFVSYASEFPSYEDYESWAESRDD